MDLFYTLLLAASVHRLWLYEDVFAPARAKITAWNGGRIIKPLQCPPCFLFWALALSFAAYPHLAALDDPISRALLAATVWYAPLRAVLWLTSSLPQLLPMSLARHNQREYMNKVRELAERDSATTARTVPDIRQQMINKGMPVPCPNCKKEKNK